MSNTKRSIGALIAKNFRDADRPEMNDAFAQKFGREPDPAVGDDALRAELQAAYNVPQAGPTTPKATKNPPKPAAKAAAPKPTKEPPNARVDLPPQVLPAPSPQGRSRIPQLNPTGRWDGRMRLCTFHKRDGSPNQQCESIGWNGVIWNILLETPVQMPWPYYQSALNTAMKDEGSEAVSNWVPQKDKRLQKVVTPAYHRTVNMTDHGDVPGTEDLPIDYVDFFQREARKTEVFKNLTRPALIMVHNILFEQLPMTYFRDMANEDIRIKIAVCLGTEFEQLVQGDFYMQDLATA